MPAPGTSGQLSCVQTLHLRSCLSALSVALAAAMVAPALAVDPPYATATRPLEPYQRDAAYRLSVPASPAPSPGDSTPAPDARPFAREVESASQAAGVDPELVHALIGVESAYRPDAVSPKGALGLMQLLPETASRYGVKNAIDVESNLSAGTRHLRDLMQSFGDRLDLVLAAYNAGAGAVRKHGNRVPPYAETRHYVPAVLKRYRPRVPATPVPKANRVRDYLPGTRLDPDAVHKLP